MSEPFPYRLSWNEHERLAADAEPSDDAPELLVSVDWDFFLPPPDLGSYPDEVAEMLAPGVRWALDEWFSAQRQARLWRELKERVALAGYDIDELFATEGWADYQQLAQLLLQGFRFARCWVADSHAWGAHVALLSSRRAGGPVQLLSFDAHHDCGYHNYPGDNPERSQRRAAERPSCDDWVQASLVHGSISRATIVYPNWRGLGEWERLPPTLGEPHYWRVDPISIDNWHPPHLPLKANLLLVRSSAYSPPFAGADQSFAELVQALTGGDYTCLDCARPGGVSFGPHHGCRPRVLDL